MEKAELLRHRATVVSQQLLSLPPNNRSREMARIEREESEILYSLVKKKLEEQASIPSNSDGD